MRGIYDVGYTCGSFDILHLEDVDRLVRARGECDFLFVGVFSDGVCAQVTGAAPVNPYAERLAIVRAMRPADAAVGHDADLVTMWKRLQFSTLLLGIDDEVDLDPDLGAGVRVLRLDGMRSDSELARRREP